MPTSVQVPQTGVEYNPTDVEPVADSAVAEAAPEAEAALDAAPAPTVGAAAEDTSVDVAATAATDAATPDAADAAGTLPGLDPAAAPASATAGASEAEQQAAVGEAGAAEAPAANGLVAAPVESAAATPGDDAAAAAPAPEEKKRKRRSKWDTTADAAPVPGPPPMVLSQCCRLDTCTASCLDRAVRTWGSYILSITSISRGLERCAPHPAIASQLSTSIFIMDQLGAEAGCGAFHLLRAL